MAVENETESRFFTSSIKQAFGEMRLKQLEHLLDPNFDKPLTWEGEVAVRKVFHSSYTYKNEKVNITASRDETERIRAHAGFAIFEELRELGMGAQAQDVITQAKVNTVFSSEPQVK